MRTDDLTRRLLQAEREIQVLRDEIERLRANRSSGLMPSQTAILEIGTEIAGREEVDADEFTVSYGSAILWDIPVTTLSGSGTLSMKKVLAGATARYTKLINPWLGTLEAGAFILGAPYKSHYVPASEECPPPA